MNSSIKDIATDMLDILPNPVLIKDSETRYVWVNKAFEEMFCVNRQELAGRLDKEVFPNRQVAQCNGGDLRVLSTGELDEAYEAVVDPERGERETITRKIRHTSVNGEHFLLGVMHDVTEVTTANRKLQASSELLEHQAKLLNEMANTDSLTGSLNRRAIYSAATEQLNSNLDACALLVLDIDHFKSINDRFGHGAGDLALQHFVRCVQSQLREQDILGRTGGEEFAALLPGVSMARAEKIADRIRQHLNASPISIEDTKVSMSVSIGLKHFGQSPKPTFDEMMLQADKGLYQAKEQGRNRTVVVH